MQSSGSFVLFLLIAVVSVVLAWKMKSWIVKLLAFLLALGAANFMVNAATPDNRWSLFVTTAIFIIVAVAAWRAEGTGNRVLSIILFVLGAALIILLLDGLGSSAPSSIWSAITDSLYNGWQVFISTFQRIVE